ncbi:Uncharacterised protein [Sphingobacterium mizutaii]|uniref:Recombinase zinc beta ribbon domain-containing protein n=1 Tax=Sphingobacterium mizutaii TaxID=1010 RepID=A0AAJ5BZS5_9SPHI|nr:hypothetical protein SAMN05192578_10154 [Sphingobacterium mizutaii]SNV45975.1 Uncharacterised protein [Sphingobacterium mizutaii]
MRGVLECPYCKRKLSGSFSRGSTKRYPYYHCHGRCKTRINATLLNDCYQHELQRLILSDKVSDLFGLILEDWNTNTHKTVHVQHRNLAVRKLNEQESIMSQARKLFVVGALKPDNYSNLKREFEANAKCLRRELMDINRKLESIGRQSQIGSKSFLNIFLGFSSLDLSDKKHLVNLIPPLKVDFKTGNMTLGLNSVLSKILLT